MFTMTRGIAVFQDVTPCGLVEVSRISEELATLFDEGNVHTLLPDYTALHPQFTVLFSMYDNVAIIQLSTHVCDMHRDIDDFMN